MPNLVILAGNIASGKTTILNKLNLDKYNGSVVIVPEPTDEWQAIKTCDGQTFFDKMYANSHPQSAFQFQLVAIVTRITLLREAIKANPDAKVFVCERSATEDCHVFAKMFRDVGRMTSDEIVLIELLLRQWDMCIDGQTHYMCTGVPANVCFARLSARLESGVRPSESSISLEYLQSLEAAYEKFFSTLDPSSVHMGTSAVELEELLDKIV